MSSRPCKAHRPVTREACVLRDGHDGMHRTTKDKGDPMSWGGPCGEPRPGNRWSAEKCDRERGHVTEHGCGPVNHRVYWPNSAAVPDPSRCPEHHPDSTASDPIRCDKMDGHDMAHTSLIDGRPGAKPKTWGGCRAKLTTLNAGEVITCERREGHDGKHRSGIGYSWDREDAVSGRARKAALEERVAPKAPEAPGPEPVRLADRVVLRSHVWEAVKAGRSKVDVGSIAYSWYVEHKKMAPADAPSTVPDEFRAGVVRAIYEDGTVAVLHNTGYDGLWNAGDLMGWAPEDADIPSTPRFKGNDSDWRARRALKSKLDPLGFAMAAARVLPQAPMPAERPNYPDDHPMAGLPMATPQPVPCPFAVGDVVVPVVPNGPPGSARSMVVERMNHDGRKWLVEGRTTDGFPHEDVAGNWKLGF